MFPSNGNYLIPHPLGCINIINLSRFATKHFPPKFFSLAEISLGFLPKSFLWDSCLFIPIKP
jgi:hypothetical protein